MSKKTILTACGFLLFLITLLSVNSISSTYEASVKKVLVVHSYHPQYEWVSTISRGIKRVFEQSKNVQVETFYMNTKIKTSEEWKQESGRWAREIISKWNPDVVITVDDNAQEYVGKYYAGKDHPKIIFCGVNNKPEKYGYPSSNITGILERPHIKETLDLLSSFVPNVKNIAVISDNSTTSQGAVEYIKDQLKSLDKKAVAYDMPATFAQWKSCISVNQNKADAVLVYMYHTIKRKGQEESMVPREVMEWTISNCSIPVVGFFNFTVDDGALLGVVESGIEHGREAAMIAMNILDGKDIKLFPIKTASKGIIMFNNKTACKLKIPVLNELRGQIDIMVGD
ncbi:MAG: ABC transporter substrate binding protein [Pseudomonadota bacterium]